MVTSTHGGTCTDSAASSEFSTNSRTVVYSALPSLSKPAMLRFSAKNSAGVLVSSAMAGGGAKPKSDRRKAATEWHKAPLRRAPGEGALTEVPRHAPGTGKRASARAPMSWQVRIRWLWCCGAHPRCR